MLRPSEIAAAFSACNGESRRLASEDVRSRVLTLSSVSKTPQPFWSDTLKNCLLTEAEMLLDRALYHICAGNSLVWEGKLTWAIVTFYYSSFFAVHALVRLQDESLVRIQNRYYRVRAGRPGSNDFDIRSVANGRSHQAIWNLYHHLYSKFPWPTGEFLPITSPADPLWDIGRRSDANYDLAKGYGELRMTPADIRREIKRRHRDVFEALHRSLADDDLAVESRALLRIKLLIDILQLVASRGPYQSYFESRRARRRDYVSSHLNHPSLKSRLASWLA